MKDFLKMMFACVAGLLIFCVASFFLMTATLVGIAALGEKQPVMPREAVLQINFDDLVLGEQTTEADPVAMLTSGSTVAPLGIYSAIKAINAAAEDPAVKFIYMRPDNASGGLAQLEELRTALKNFRNSGKAIVSYIESPSNAGYYLASVSDKIYMTVHDGGMSMLNGLSSRLIFLKDLLDELGVNVQLIRHGKYKSAGEMYIRNSSSPENMEQNKEMIDAVWSTYADEMAESRGTTAEALNAMLNNLELNFPTDFLEKGLVDELVTREQLQQNLCNLFVAKNINDVKSISLADYAKLKDVPNLKSQKKVAVIYAEGNIVDGNGTDGVAGDRFAKVIADVRNDDAVKAVVLRVNSPGGSVLASEKIKAEIKLIQEKGIPVIASYGDYAASGGYWISAGCDHIISNATTLTGSIGVFSMIPDIGGTIKDKLHVTLTPVNSNKHADMLGMTRPLTASEVDYMQASVERIYSKFTELVAEGRDMTVADVDAIAQGRVWAGSDALKIGLVDEIGTIEDAIRYAALSIEGVESVNDVQVVAYPKPQTALESILESLTGSGESILAKLPFERGKVYARIPYDITIE